MKPSLRSLLALSVVLSLVGSCSPPPAQPTVQPTEAASFISVGGSAGVTASGTLVPAQQVDLTFQANGQIMDLKVNVGDTVGAGQVLARLAGEERLAAEVTAAEVERVAAQQSLSALRAGAELRLAQVQLDVANAEKKLAEDERVVRYLSSSDMTYYQNQVERAQDALTTTLQSAANSELAMAVEKARQVLTDATNALNEAKSLETRYPGGFANQVIQAQQAFDEATQRLANAQLLYDQSKINSDNAVEDAQRKLDQAVSNFAAAQRGPDASTLALAQDQVALSLAVLHAAQETLARLQPTGIDPDLLAAAEARLRNAEAQQAATQAALDQLTLVAPFAGTISAVHLRAGEAATVGTTVLEMIDTRRWRVETSDVGELAIGAVQVGQRAFVIVNAFNAQEIEGTVIAIAPNAVVQLGDTTYRVTIELDENPLALRWGMTARLRIETGK